MIIGILSDTHDRLERTRSAVRLLVAEGAELLVHCGDLASPAILRECSALPLYFVFGNHDADNAPALRELADERGAHCLGWGGAFTIAKKRIAVAHGHMAFDLLNLLDTEPDFLLSGHTHIAKDWREGATRRINPGALVHADDSSVAILDTNSDEVRILGVLGPDSEGGLPSDP